MADRSPAAPAQVGLVDPKKAKQCEVNSSKRKKLSIFAYCDMSYFALFTRSCSLSKYFRLKVSHAMAYLKDSFHWPVSAARPSESQPPPPLAKRWRGGDAQHGARSGVMVGWLEKLLVLLKQSVLES